MAIKGPEISPEKAFLPTASDEEARRKPLLPAPAGSTSASGEKDRAERPAMLSASELERYAYCPLSWWLDRQGQKADGPQAEEGDREHARAGEALEGARQDEAEARRSETGVLWFALVATILATVGLTLLPFSYADVFARMLTVVALIWLLAASYFLYRYETIPHPQEKTNYETLIMIFGMVAAVLTIPAVSLAVITDPLLARVLEVVAVAWLVGASLFFYNSLKRRALASVVKRREGIAAAAGLEYVDAHRQADGKPRLFVSERYGLSGRPDLVLKEGDKYVPVEIKTGRTPRGPLFSHILQLGAYLLLLEETYGSPAGGILRYAERDDHIEWTDDLKMLVTLKLDEMRQKLRTGEVHRNHNRPGKCAGCSRRSGCPERLNAQ